MKQYSIDPDQKLSLEIVASIVKENATIILSSKAIERISNCRRFLDSKMDNHDDAVYGINTGFGSLCNTVISMDDLEQLQKNLLLSHACGTGAPIPNEIVKLMLLLKVQGISYGHSGVALETAQRLCDFYNFEVLPVVYEQGSLGASGDLAPLSHLALPLIGEGEVTVKGIKMPSTDALKSLGWSPLKLASKEGLALINGTQFMSAFALHILLQAKQSMAKLEVLASMSLDAFNGRPEPFDPSLHRVRSHAGQVETALRMREALQGSEIISSIKEHVQDPYSFRCIPQVHGGSRDAIAFAEQIIEREINSVTDNPIVFPEENKIVSGGNFHGQPLALCLDFLAIALAELGSISERRVYKLISGQRNLPPFLTKDAGLNSGMMIVQYTAASIVSQNKQLCTPASVDTIDSSNGQEDHVSMGANAATKCSRVMENVITLFSIELLVAAQAIEFRRPLRSSMKIEAMHADVREHIPFIDQDVFMHAHMVAARKVWLSN